MLIKNLNVVVFKVISLILSGYTKIIIYLINNSYVTISF